MELVELLKINDVYHSIINENLVLVWNENKIGALVSKSKEGSGAIEFKKEGFSVQCFCGNSCGNNIKEAEFEQIRQLIIEKELQIVFARYARYAPFKEAVEIKHLRTKIPLGKSAFITGKVY